MAAQQSRKAALGGRRRSERAAAVIVLFFLTGISLPTLIQHMAEPLAKAFRTSGDEGAGVV